MDKHCSSSTASPNGKKNTKAKIISAVANILPELECSHCKHCILSQREGRGGGLQHAEPARGRRQDQICTPKAATKHDCELKIQL